MSQANFSVYDYCVFALMLGFSAFIGIYYAFKDRHAHNTSEFLLGGRNLQIFPVAMSILASFTSAISILGFSQEMYKFGTMYWMIGFSYFITQPLAAEIYVPLFHSLKITSAYEYLQMRFNHNVRVLASAIFSLQMLLYMAVVLYTPSVAIQQVTGLSLWVSILLTGAVCTIYTTIGGIKAVIWTDTFQVFVMFGGLIAIIVKGTMSIGGFSELWQRAKSSGRVEFFDFNPNPFERHTFWTLMVGGFFTSLTVYGSNQATIQRYLTMKTIKEAKRALYVNLIGTFAILTITCLTGLIAYGIYYKCDILTAKLVTKGEQILPYLVMDMLGDYPGIPGLFVACVYSAALSTVSSGLNSLAAVCLKDFIQPLYKNDELSEKRATNISKLLACIFGILTVGLAFLCQFVGATVLQISLSIFGLLGGPLLGVISLGMFCRFANSHGAFFGLIISVIVNLWIGIGAVLYGKPPKLKPMSMENCNYLNRTYYENIKTPSNSTIVDVNNQFGIKYLYRLSYLWYAGLAMAVVFSIGILVSLITGPLDSSKLNENLFFNYKRFNFFSILNKKKRNSPFEKSFDGENNLALDLVKDFDDNKQKGDSLKKNKAFGDDSIIITSL